MRIFIVGAGEVGFHIASSLSREGHDLVIIERDSARVKWLESSLDVLAVHGDGCNPEILRSLGIRYADLFFAVSNSDSSNLLAALTARRMGASRCVARVGDRHHASNPLLQSDSEIVALFPERLVAEEIVALTRVPGASKARFFAGGRLVLVRVHPSPAAGVYGIPLKDLKGPEGWILVGISRGGEVTIPRGDTVLRPGQSVYAVGRTESVADFLNSIGTDSPPAKRVLIAGAGQVGSWLAKLLTKEKIGVTVVQRGAERAFELAAEVADALVLRGDATDPAMLREAGIAEADYFVAATQDDETNILASLLGRELGARTVISLFNRPEFLRVLQAARIDLPLSPRLAMAGTILRMVHRREILHLDLLEGGNAEVVEFQVPKRARALKKPLAELSFPREAIVGSVIRGEEIHVPDGSFRFEEGDRALVFTLADALPGLERLFRGK